MEGVTVGTSNTMTFHANWINVATNVGPTNRTILVTNKEGSMLELTVLDFWCVLGAGVLIGWGLACLGAWMRRNVF